MNLTKQQLIIISVIGVVVLVFVLIFVGILPGLKGEPPERIKAELEFWGVFDSARAYESVFNRLQKTYREVTVRYREFTNQEEYEATLLDALAAGKGPDVFMVWHRNLLKNINKITPVPPTKISLLQLRNLFPQVVEADFVQQGNIYALPLSIDTLSLIYNQDIFNQAAITGPPEDWGEFEELIPKLLQKDEEGSITRAAAAIGGSRESMRQASDILNLLMLQTGTRMVSEDFREATFASDEGINALNFYTKFADTESEVYTWNDTLGNAREVFSEERVAMIFDYAESIRTLKSKNPFVNLGIAPIPQPIAAEKQLAYANYWGYTVSRQSKYKNLAWDFVMALATDTINVRSYLEKTGRSPALRSLIERYLDNPDLHVFARQALIARSWPQIDPHEIQEIFSDMVQSVVGEDITPRAALREAEEEVTRLMQKRL